MLDIVDRDFGKTAGLAWLRGTAYRAVALAKAGLPLHSIVPQKSLFPESSKIGVFARRIKAIDGAENAEKCTLLAAR